MTRRDDAERRPLRAFTIAALAFVGMVAIIGDLASRHRSAPKTSGQVIAEARDRHHVLDASNAEAAAEDDALPGAERDAGEMWARAHKPTNANDCPDHSAPFRQGCVDEIAAQRRAQ